MIDIVRQSAYNKIQELNKDLLCCFTVKTVFLSFVQNEG